jgi:hypothetical protein
MRLVFVCRDAVAIAEAIGGARNQVPRGSIAAALARRPVC